MTIGERIKARRKELGMHQSKLARKVGMSRQCISYIENDRFEPRLFSAICIADALEITLDELCGRGKVYGKPR